MLEVASDAAKQAVGACSAAAFSTAAGSPLSFRTTWSAAAARPHAASRRAWTAHLSQTQPAPASCLAGAPAPRPGSLPPMAPTARSPQHAMHQAHGSGRLAASRAGVCAARSPPRQAT
eukprot:365455-Chlamydomonas_euryale.AAC.2